MYLQIIHEYIWFYKRKTRFAKHKKQANERKGKNEQRLPYCLHERNEARINVPWTTARWKTNKERKSKEKKGKK